MVSGQPKMPMPSSGSLILPSSFFSVADLRVHDWLDERINQRAEDGNGSQTHIDEASDADADEHETVHVLVHDPVDGRAEAGRPVPDAGDAAVDEVQQRRDEQGCSRRVGVAQGVKGAGGNPEKERQQRDLVRRQAQPGKCPGRRVDAMDQVVTVFSQVSRLLLREELLKPLLLKICQGADLLQSGGQREILFRWLICAGPAMPVRRPGGRFGALLRLGDYRHRLCGVAGAEYEIGYQQE